MSLNTDKPHNLPAASPGYETRDADVRGIVRWLGYLTAIMIFTAIACFILFRRFKVTETSSATDSPFAQTRQTPSGPQLQVYPRADLLRYQEQQRQALESYSWENRGSGVVRVPIERAMDLLVQKGLPATGGDSASPASSPASGANAGAKTSPKMDGAADKDKVKP